MSLQELQPMTVAPAAAPDATPLRVAFKTLGCRLNQYDTEAMKTTMADVYAIDFVDWNEPAQLYVINSCTVTMRADQECRRMARQVKRLHPSSKVVVVGCYAQTQPEALAAVKEIDGVVGNTNKDDVTIWLPEVLGSEVPVLNVEDFAEDPIFDSPTINEFAGRSRATVKIQDGCNLRCTYCLIWRARGPGRSRTPESVIAQLQHLVEKGYPETILTGIHLGGYGRDFEDSSFLLPELLDKCLAEVPELRLRLSSIHPNEVTPRLLNFYREHPRMRPHLHISLQSGSSSVLKNMKRPYRSERAWEAMRQAATVMPHFGLGADIIVGFPGESDADFEETRRMVAELPFSYLHVFRFSPRPGTEAVGLPDQVDHKVIVERSRILRELADRKTAEFARNLVGTQREAVIEADTNDDDLRQATTDNYVVVMVPNTSQAAGTLVNITITEYRDDKLYAQIDSHVNICTTTSTGD
ncbi:MAG: threonylcarbamoyladenosine tRNA methylthiotransferase MtaB [Candidatus Krumholzibacteriia bacterium]|jgi:threonylcarbamoyladenosine tRNA methylthiotransferase MtaB